MNHRPRPQQLPRRVAAVLTPCPVRVGEPDPAAMGKLCRFLLDRGCDGLFVLSSTGEAPILDETQRRALLAGARESIGEGGFIFAGVSGLGAKHSIRLSKNAAEDGADVAVIMAPFFVKLSQDFLRDYIIEIAEGSPIPIAIYHHHRLPTAFSPETVAALAAHPNIIAMKDTSAEPDRISQLVRAASGQDFKIYQGREPFILSGLEQGAHGSVTAIMNCVPEWHRDLYQAWQKGDLPTAKIFQEKINRLCSVFQEPEIGECFAHFVRVMTLPLCQRGLFPSVASMTGNVAPGFDKWLNGRLAVLGFKFTPEGVLES